MSIIVCGINHKTAPLALRERVVFPQEKLPLYLADLQQNENLQEAIILSTCNRSEVYGETDHPDRLLHWFCQQHNMAPETLKPYLYLYQDEAAVEHIMRVACGIDSMVVGETQILGQLKNAFAESCAASLVGPLFNRLFQQIFALAKEVRANTAIGACPVSIASAAVSLAKQSNPQWQSVLVIGAGSTVELLLRYLSKENLKHIRLINRSRENAEKIAQHYALDCLEFAALPQALMDADTVITATASPQPILTKAMMESIMQKRQAPITLIDIAVPRDIEESVNELFSVALYCIDDLKSIIQQHLRGREHAAEKAQELIRIKTQEFMAWHTSLDIVATTIRAYRNQVEEICRLELIKATKQLQRGDDALQVLSQFAYSFTNKMMHTPSAQLRQAGAEGRVDMLQLAKQLFAIPQTEAIEAE